MTESLFNNFGEHVGIFLGGMSVLGIVAHAVNTFPTPENKYGAWLLGTVQYVVGQRIAAMNTLKGQDSVVTSVAKINGTGDGRVGNGKETK